MPTLLKPSSRCSGGSTCLDQRKLSHEPSLHGSLLGIQVLPHCTPGGQGILYGKNKPPLISMGCKNSQIQRRQCQNRKDVIAQGRQQMWEQEVLPHAAGAPQPPLAPLLVLVASRWHDPDIHPWAPGHHVPLRPWLLHLSVYQMLLSKWGKVVQGAFQY